MHYMNNISYNITALSSFKLLIASVLFIASLMFANDAYAKVRTQTENGFAIIFLDDVKAEPEAIWQSLIMPNIWWSQDHSWSGNSENFYLEPNVNGCFCELLTIKDEDGNKDETGAVEHMRIIHINKNKVLRMTGALGPLQSEAVNGTLTIALQSNGDGTTKVSFSYIVGGYMRYKVEEISSAVDNVIGEQFNNLLKLHGAEISGPDDSEVSQNEKTDTSNDETNDDEESDDKDKVNAPVDDPRKER